VMQLGQAKKEERCVGGGGGGGGGAAAAAAASSLVLVLAQAFSLFDSWYVESLRLSQQDLLTLACLAGGAR